MKIIFNYALLSGGLHSGHGLEIRAYFCCIQNFYLGMYIVGYMVGNLVLRRWASRVVKHDFRPYIPGYTSRIESFEYGYPHSETLLQFCLKFERCKLHKATCHPTKCDIINDVKLFSTVYCRINCCKFLTLSNRMSRYNSKCIKLFNVRKCKAC